MNAERVFVDTNVVVYAQSADGAKSDAAFVLLETQPVISTQVVNETISVLTRKHGFALADAYEVADSLLTLCEVMPVDADTVPEGMRVAIRYRLSHWDALIVAAALRAGCTLLYSEDMQHGLVFDERLTIVNPFAASTH